MTSGLLRSIARGECQREQQRSEHGPGTPSGPSTASMLADGPPSRPQAACETGAAVSNFVSIGLPHDGLNPPHNNNKAQGTD